MAMWRHPGHARPELGLELELRRPALPPAGFYKFLVSNVKDLELLLLHNRKYAAEIAHNVSTRKRKEIVERADEVRAPASEPDPGRALPQRKAVAAGSTMPCTEQAAGCGGGGALWQRPAVRPARGARKRRSGAACVPPRPAWRLLHCLPCPPSSPPQLNVKVLNRNAKLRSQEDE